MITVTPGDPNYEWIDPREREEKYPWNEWLDNRPHQITQFQDFESETSTMVSLLRRKGKQRNLKLTIFRGFDTEHNSVIAFATYPEGELPPAVPKPRFQFVGHPKITNFAKDEGKHGGPFLRDNETHPQTANEYLEHVNQTRALAGQAPIEMPICKYCGTLLSANAEAYGECFRYGQFTHMEHHENG